MLEIRDLSLAFLDKGKVFENINMKIKENTITLLTGKSGCGKSSLFMCITRVIPHTIEGNIGGQIIYKGENIENKGIEDISSRIAYMFQDPDSQLCTFTVEDEIAFGLENIKTDPAKMDSIIDDILELVDIQHLRKRKLNQLSGGEKQKVALASILALDPELILMDEPTANLDPDSTRDMVKLIKRLRDEMGRTILIIEHKINEFSEIIDEVIKFDSYLAVKVDKLEFIEEYRRESRLPEQKKDKAFGEAVISVSGLSFSYNKDMEVLRNVEFSLKRGEITAVVGSNGAGKSTLSKLLMGLLKPKGGRILINNQELSSMNPRRVGENMGLVFQNPEHQFIKMTVEKEMALSLEIKGESQETIKSRVAAYLSMFDLEEHRLLNPFSLSQGQKRRLSAASMMINGQSILILDEPTYGQDRDNLKKLIELLYQINSEGTSILMITHDMDMVMSCCDRVIYLDEGRVKYEGSVEGFKGSWVAEHE